MSYGSRKKNKADPENLFRPVYCVTFDSDITLKDFRSDMREEGHKVKRRNYFKSDGISYFYFESDWISSETKKKLDYADFVLLLT